MSDRRPLVGAVLFVFILLLCFGFALLLLRGGGGAPEETGPRVGVVQVQGVITGSRRGIEDLRRFRKDDSIKAIVVRIDSPGGAVGPSQELYREIVLTRRTKPVVASLGAVAASGGYYIAAACDRIIASPGTITGSIGVITETTSFSELLALARIETHTFVSGRFKDTGSPLRPLREDEKVYLQSFVEEIYRQFLRDVAQGRRLPEAAIKPIADGRILSGEKALALKLIDELGNLSDALGAAVKLAKVQGEPVPVYPPRHRGLLMDLLGDTVDGLAARIKGALGDATRVEVRDPALSSSGQD